ncbi:hypothetical protein PIB30_000077 [Stylosanthes scabra]|uniref:GRF-type domain-containing protein n=1 Tax=Stylosanthes scabra TaxID=79078 RepID=A0ABU6Q214_9FABA|nr:hypothetical protein [Stylosanthes scabra]
MDEIGMEEQLCASIGDQSWNGTAGSGRSSNGGAGSKRKKKFHAPICNCGMYAILFQSSTNSNPNKLFFGCSNFKKSTPHCRYFAWLDDFVSSFCVNEDAKTCQVMEPVKRLEEKMAALERIVLERNKGGKGKAAYFGGRLAYFLLGIAFTLCVLAMLKF